MTTELAIINQADLQSAGQILATTKSWVTAYKKKHDTLLTLANKEGVKLTPETDQAINDYLSSIKKATKTAEDSRKPFTQKLNQVIALFTTEENAMKGELSSDLQALRDKSVAAYKKQEALDAAKEQAKLDKAKARIELFAEAESQIRAKYASLLSDDKGKLMEVYEDCTLEMYDSTVELFEMVVGTFAEEMWAGITAVLVCSPLGNTKHFTQEELTNICDEAREGKFEKVSPHYQSEIQAYAQHLASIMPARKEELEAGLAESSAAAKLKEEQQVAEEKQAEAAQVKTEQTVKAQVSAVIIDSQINTANRSVSIPKAQSIESYEIVLTDNNLGWSEIFKFYIAHSELEIEGKTKLESMKLFAERIAKSQGLRIDSPYIQYEPKYKAVTKSKKAA